MRISVVVPAFNEERELPASLASIRAAMAAFATLGWSSELIVCDNNSTDRTADIARGAGATVVFEPINQIGRARNSGAAVATGDWLIFVDADSQPTRELFADVAEAIGRGDVLAGGGTVALDNLSGGMRGATRVWNAISRTCRYAAGSFIFCETAAFREVGGFNLELYASEEVDLSRQLKRLARRRGKRFVILTAHPLRTSDRKYHLYTPREGLGFLLKTMLTGGRTLKRKEDCFTWYDGRR